MDIKEAQELIIKFKNTPEHIQLTQSEKVAWHTARIVIENAIADGYVLCKVDGALMGIEYHPLVYKDDYGHKVVNIDVVKSKIKGACK